MLTSALSPQQSGFLFHEQCSQQDLRDYPHRRRTGRCRSGADAIGFVFYAKSPRAVDVRQARAIIAELPPFVTTVGLFVNASRCELNEILEVVPLDLLQFHGDETPQDCEGYHRPGSRPCVCALAMTWRRPVSVTRVPAAFCWTPMCQACQGNRRGVRLVIGTGASWQADHSRGWAVGR